MFPPRTRADVGMVQCVPARYGKTTWRKNRRNKEEGRSMQRGGPACPRKTQATDFEYICTIPTSGNILLRLVILLPSGSPISPPAYCYAIVSVQLQAKELLHEGD